MKNNLGVLEYFCTLYTFSKTMLPCRLGDIFCRGSSVRSMTSVLYSMDGQLADFRNMMDRQWLWFYSDFLTVNETANDAPTEDGAAVNTPKNLSLEATLINHTFLQQVLKKVWEVFVD